MSEKALPAGTQITLAFSARSGIVAIASGARYREATKLLGTAGFTGSESGTRVLNVNDPDAARQALTTLTHLAADRHITLTASSRVWLGDTTTRIAALLPGTWQSRIEIYAMPNWQQDLTNCLWDDGGLITAVRNERIPYAAVLIDHRGTELLVVDKPGSEDEILVGVLAPNGLDGPFADDPASPRSITTRTDPALAAQAISIRLLPARQRAVYQRRLQEVQDRLAHARSTEIARVLVRSCWPPDDGTGIGATILGQLEHAHHEALWDDFRSFLLHGPELLNHLETVGEALHTGRSGGEAALPALREALRHGAHVNSQWLTTVQRLRDADLLAETTYVQAVAERTAAAGPALSAWLEHGPVFVELARRHLPPTVPQPPQTAAALPPPANPHASGRRPTA